MLRKMRRKPKLSNPGEYEEYLHRHIEKAPLHEGPDRRNPREYDED